MSSCSHEHDNALHGVHGHHDIKARIAEAELLCTAVGARLTPLRKEVLELILNASAPKILIGIMIRPIWFCLISTLVYLRSL